MIATGSLFGLDNSLVKFINSRNDKGEFVRSSFLFVTVLSVLGAVLFAASSTFFSPTIHSFFSTGYHYGLLIFFSVATTLNILCDSIYLSHKKTLLTLSVTTFHSALKAVFPFFFIGFGTAGILLAAAVAQLVGLIINITILNQKWHYFTHISVSPKELAGIWKYSADNYISSILSLLPNSIIPIIIINRIGVAESAYYYIVVMVTNLMYTISGATTKSLFAEGVHDTENLQEKTIKSIYFIIAVLTPAIVLLFLLAEVFLGFFGAEYAKNASLLLKLIGLSTMPYGIFSIANAIFRIKNKSHYIVICTGILSTLEISLTYYFINDGLYGVGLALLISASITALIASILVFTLRKI
jgi:O-antigen/teichoic acid export membrane protein